LDDFDYGLSLCVNAQPIRLSVSAVSGLRIQVSYVTPPLTHTYNLCVEQPTASVSGWQVGSFKDTESRI